MKKNITFVLLLTIFCNCKILADNIFVLIDAGDEFNSFTGKKTDYSGKQLIFSSRKASNGGVYMEISVKSGSVNNCITNGSSARRDNKRYIKGLDGAMLRDKFVIFGTPYAYYELLSNSSYDDRQTFFAIACYVMGDDNIVMIKKQTYQNLNIESPLFETIIVSYVKDFQDFVSIKQFLDEHIPQIAMPHTN